MSTARTVVTAFVEAIHNRPDDFVIGEHTIEDRKTGLHFWIVNGPPFFGVYRPYEMRFGFIQGVRFGWWVRRFKAATAATKLREIAE